ncbi:enoyl-CoA hydratase-related protein [Arthrobacter sp. FW306-2-2C-D06B]|uniref:enoyl-CoA hydratase-related protein n=1 Tax=Arthrobacter sp. FW306-2-2C-D06B TaxID=2879618 RepID=UPI001EFF8C68|nr:enoyl-CoA hydratase-related protein [Arthrobacter sp. FW306-2-2C-D06B]UKA60501.1 enoyl-CoA hydratase/isomerase family protein [Arthrobacter sp. FW306-2-2C-D06B]
MLNTAIHWHESHDGIVSLVIDDPDRSVNTVNSAFIEALAASVERLELVQDRIAGVILSSAKKSFLAGGDLNRLMAVDPTGLREFVDDLNVRKSYTQRLEMLKRPVVAIINGPALGGGLELALCCHRSIGVDSGSTIVGLPEPTLGLIPGAGGIVRTVRRLGVDQALDSVLLTGRRLPIREAVDIGLIDDVAASAEAADAAARKWILSNPSVAARSATSMPKTPRPLPRPTATPTRRAIVRVANRSMHTDLETALHFESDMFGSVVVSDATKNSIRTHFFATNAVRKRAKNLSGLPASKLLLIPRDESAADKLKAGSWGEVADVGESTCAVGNANGPDVNVALPLMAEGEWPEMWLAPDFVGDGQRVAEYAAGVSRAGEAAISTLATAGVVAIPVAPGMGSFGRILAAALAQAVKDCESLGYGAAAVDRALAWADLPSRRPPGSQEPFRSSIQEDVSLACRLLNHIAQAGIDAVASGTLVFPEDADVASVRAGGFPGWTGGVANWMAHGHRLAMDLYQASESEFGVKAAVQPWKRKVDK